MPRLDVPVTQVTRSGVAPPTPETGDPANNHQVANSGNMLLLVANTGVTVPRTVTLHLTPRVDGQTVTPRTVSVPQSTSRYIGPFPTGDYGRLLQVDVDNAELTLAALTV